MSNAIKHFITITKHRHQVIKNCKRCGILFQGLRHDLSKYSPTEFLSGAKFYQGNKSPNDAERRANGYSVAWLHHKGRNRHHFEYWTDYCPPTGVISPVEMPTKYVVEMFCDRVAASKIYLKDKYTDSSPLEYFMQAKNRRIIHPKTSDLLEGMLVMLSEKGEKETFEYIKKNIIKKK
ncbi:MAG: DUF5662 family protein [Acutalibacteraceae bacterium]